MYFEIKMFNKIQWLMGMLRFKYEYCVLIVDTVRVMATVQ